MKAVSHGRRKQTSIFGKDVSSSHVGLFIPIFIIERRRNDNKAGASLEIARWRSRLVLFFVRRSLFLQVRLVLPFQPHIFLRAHNKGVRHWCHASYGVIVCRGELGFLESGAEGTEPVARSLNLHSDVSLALTVVCRRIIKCSLHVNVGHSPSERSASTQVSGICLPSNPTEDHGENSERESRIHALSVFHIHVASSCTGDAWILAAA